MNHPAPIFTTPASDDAQAGAELAQAQARPLPLVALGASAGGLEPISEFLASVPPNCGAAYVVIQHIDPHHKGMLPELLQRVTCMPVHEISDGMEIAADSVYVIPPGHELELEDGRLALRQPGAPLGQRMPIDVFLQALARERQDLAAGVILSGMGNDGTRGLQAIREAGGLALVQQPSSARFEAMPAAAIAAGAADLVAPPAELAARLAGHWISPAASAVPHLLHTGSQREALQQVFQLVLQQTGANFSDYKLNTVLRRIERRMKLHGVRTLRDYLAFLRQNGGETELLFKEMLIGVTSFFRDPKVWAHLQNVALPHMLDSHPDGAALKAWVPACSTGEEAYSLAIAFSEAVRLLRPQVRYTLQIFATDLDPDAIDRARLGEFGAAAVEGMDPELLQRYFQPAEKGGYRICKELRNSIIFACQNVISDPPFTKLDILCCRNLLIYFNAKLQEQMIPLFHYALKPNGLLMLGSADTPGQYTELFAPLPGSGRLYRRMQASSGRMAPYFPTRAGAVTAPAPIEARLPSMSSNLQTLVERQLLKKHTPAAVLLNAHGDILYIHGRTGVFLEPAAGKANWNIHAMARDSLRYELAELLKRVTAGAGMLTVRGPVLVDAQGRPAQLVEMTAEAVDDGAVLLTMMALPLPAEKRSARSANPRVAELEQQLAQARLEIQAVRDEMQASREDLKSSNEELQSTNEELQSANEELTTSKEEMQSLNEELYTLNAELQSKLDDLSVVNGDMKNLLNSTDIATIFLDGELHIRRYTDKATQLYKLIPSDINRPLGDIVSDLIYPDLEKDAREVLRTLVFSEREIPTHSQRWYMVRIMPCRTVDNVIDGVVVTFINITDAKLLEAQLRAVQPDADQP
ncbi:chemotaxis protein CheB [Oxalobacteraceae bacterium A2-2]